MDLVLSGYDNAAIVLSGGGARCAFQAATMERLARTAGLRPKHFVGVSGGAINAALGAQVGMEGVRGFWDTLRTNDDIYRKSRFRSIFRLLRKGGVAESTKISTLCECASEAFTVPFLRRSSKRVLSSARRRMTRNRSSSAPCSPPPPRPACFRRSKCSATPSSTAAYVT